MKKSVLFIVLIFVAWHGYSQSLNYGFGVGLNCSNLVCDNYPEQNPDYKLGGQFNAILKYNFNEKFGVGIEPGFANRGAIFRSSGYSDTKININYLLLPFSVNYTLLNKFSIFIGSECSYRISAKGKTDGEKNDMNLIYNSKIDFGVIAGLSYKIFDKFDLGVRYNRGVISTIKDGIKYVDEHGNDIGETNVFNQGFTLSVAYIIN